MSIRSSIQRFVAWNRRGCWRLSAAFPRFFGAPRNSTNDLHGAIRRHIDHHTPKTILEAGGIDRPLLCKSPDYEYVGLDIEERSACYDIYDEFLVQSIELDLRRTFDMIISTTLLEHVPDNTKSFQVMYNALNTDGVSIHYIPSKNHFYSLILRLVGPRLQRTLIRYLRPDAEAVTGYPAFFDKCSPSEIETLCRAVGFSKVNVVPYYKATDYFAFFVPAFIFVAAFENIFETLGLRTFAAGMIVDMKK